MIYSNLEFIVLFAATLLAYFLAKRYTVRFYLLLASSILFYAWSGLFDTLIFFFVVAVSWLAVAFSRRWPARKGWFIPAGITVMTLHLFFWKYCSWGVSQIQQIFPSFLSGDPLLVPLPVGISFFTLQGIAYLIDYSRGEAEFMPFTTYLLFKSFFAQLVAGPIVRARQVLRQLLELNRPTIEDVSCGLALFARGFFKKIVVADRVAPFVDMIFTSPQDYGRGILLQAAAGYTVQIWADFSGYTDMGRGAARMLGIRLPENFLSPYLAKSFSEFWRRWHITLSEWIKDYLFSPLALWGRRKAFGLFFALVLTMSLSGFWHGAEWHFCIWGLYHGMLLVAERRLKLPDFGLPRMIPETLKMLGVFLCVLIGWIIFRAPNLGCLTAYWNSMFFHPGTMPPPSRGFNIYAGVLYCALEQILCYRDIKSGEAIFLSPMKQWYADISREDSSRRPWIVLGAACAGAALAFIFIGAIVLRPLNSKPFIYFQF